MNRRSGLRRQKRPGKHGRGRVRRLLWRVFLLCSTLVLAMLLLAAFALHTRAGRRIVLDVTIANLERLLVLPEEIKEVVRAGALSMGHARALVGVEPPARRLTLARRAIREGWSVRALEAAAAGTPGTGRSANI